MLWILQILWLIDRSDRISLFEMCQYQETQTLINLNLDTLRISTQLFIPIIPASKVLKNRFIRQLSSCAKINK